MEKIGITKVKLQKKGKMAVWNKSGANQIEIFLNYIYAGSNIFLERKKKIFKEICRLEPKTTEDSR